ncbi:exo-alpha-sialidase [Trypanosoma cruzi]|nr:exo-alpha-sialidase [Trypanosoma cruzi]
MEEKHSELQGKPVRTGRSHSPWTRRRDPPPPEHSHGQRDAATSPQPTHNAPGASTHPASHTLKWVLTHPPVTRRPTPRSHTRCTTPSGKETRGARSLSPLLSSCPRKKTTAARNCQHRV